MTAPARRRFVPLAILGVAFAASCGGDAPPATEEAQAPAMTAAPALTLDDATSLGVFNARMPVSGLVTAGQVTQEQFDALVEAGFENFVSLRLADEDGAGWEESHAASVGATFTRIPVAGSAGLNRETVAELARILDEAGEEGTVLYCGSSNRVGALLALKAAWVDGMSTEDALAFGRAGGMTRLESAVVELLGTSGS